MSPQNHHSYKRDTAYPTSPWTAAYQENPVHTEGMYAREEHPAEDLTQAPTWNALTTIYDTSRDEDEQV